MPEPVRTDRPGLVAVVVHGPASNPLTSILWQLGLRPLPGTSGSTVWLPIRPLRAMEEVGQ